MSFVLDTSVTMAWLFEDESSKKTDAILKRLDTEEAIVPELWLYEVANVLVMGERRKRLKEAQSRRFTELLTELPIQIIEKNNQSVWGNVLAVAREYKLSACDASYLELAMTEGLPLATLDKGLKKAAKMSGITLL